MSGELVGHGKESTKGFHGVPGSASSHRGCPRPGPGLSLDALGAARSLLPVQGGSVIRLNMKAVGLTGLAAASVATAPLVHHDAFAQPTPAFRIRHRGASKRQGVCL